MTSYVINRIPEAELDRVRGTDRDASDNPVVHVLTEGGEPLRCCLRNAQPDERAILFGYEPPLPASPYREVGAVFAHESSCAGPSFVDGYPPEWIGKPQVLRAYDAKGWIHPASRRHDGSDPDAAIATILAHPDVVQVHSRNVAYGCFMFTVTRP